MYEFHNVKDKHMLENEYLKNLFFFSEIYLIFLCFIVTLKMSMKIFYEIWYKQKIYNFCIFQNMKGKLYENKIIFLKNKSRKPPLENKTNFYWGFVVDQFLVFVWPTILMLPNTKKFK